MLCYIWFRALNIICKYFRGAIAECKFTVAEVDTFRINIVPPLFSWTCHSVTSERRSAWVSEGGTLVSSGVFIWKYILRVVQQPAVPWVVLTRGLASICGFIQNVRMKGIQNKKFISWKLIIIHVSGLCHRKGQLWKFYFMAGLHACATWWPSVDSVTMSTPQKLVQCVLWLA
jgi:hypothetical protein